MNIFQKIGSWISSGIKKIFGSREIGFLDEMEKIAIPIAEAVTHYDLNGDGKIMAAKEILEIAKSSGAVWGKELLELGEAEMIEKLSTHYLDADLKKWLGRARIVQAVIKQFGLNSFIEKNRIVDFIIQKVLLPTLGKLELTFDQDTK